MANSNRYTLLVVNMQPDVAGSDSFIKQEQVEKEIRKAMWNFNHVVIVEQSATGCTFQQIKVLSSTCSDRWTVITMSEEEGIYDLVETFDAFAIPRDRLVICGANRGPLTT